ncbi:7795_t:CDS:2 [Entrophospora sp. SA101]|nr:7795_t:CDS:2 [Entrophospora sp. SA101]
MEYDNNNSNDNFEYQQLKILDKALDILIEVTDNSGDEWFNETISEELDNAFTKLISKSKDKDVWKTEGRPKIYTGSATRTIRRNKSLLKKAAEGNASIKSFFQVQNAEQSSTSNVEQGDLNIEDKSSEEELPNFSEENFDESSEEDSSDFTLEQLEDEIKNNKIQDYRLRYVAQYLRLVENGGLKMEVKEKEYNNNLPENERIPEEACTIIRPGINRDGYWTSDDLANQVRCSYYFIYYS